MAVINSHGGASVKHSDSEERFIPIPNFIWNILFQVKRWERLWDENKYFSELVREIRKVPARIELTVTRPRNTSWMVDIENQIIAEHNVGDAVTVKFKFYPLSTPL